MRLHSYIVEHDMGFAPNPFHGVCTLAACKPKIRKYARPGDYVVGTGTAKRGLSGRLVYVMRVNEIVDFDTYWEDRRFVRKKPTMNGSVAQRYGDNIYHKDSDTKDWVQEDSFHSQKGGVIDPDNLQVDTGTTDRVLLGEWFSYWGGEGPQIPDDFQSFVHRGVGHRSLDQQELIREFISWAVSQGPIGINGEPAEWKYPPRKKQVGRSSVMSLSEGA